MNQTIVGKLNKAFGVKGYIKVIPLKPFVSDLLKNEVWYIQRGKEIIPYFVESIEKDPHFLVKFEDIDTPEAAKSITGSALLLRDKDIKIQANEDETDLDKLIGFEVENEGVNLGEIVRIEEYPQQLMAFIELNKGEIMMPLNPDFIMDIDLDAKKIIVDLPDGFVESQK